MSDLTTAMGQFVEDIAKNQRVLVMQGNDWNLQELAKPEKIVTFVSGHKNLRISSLLVKLGNGSVSKVDVAFNNGVFLAGTEGVIEALTKYPGCGRSDVIEKDKTTGKVSVTEAAPKNLNGLYFRDRFPQWYIEKEKKDSELVQDYPIEPDYKE